MRRSKRACLGVAGVLAVTGALGVATAVESQAATVHTRCTTVRPAWASGGIEACQDWLFSKDASHRLVVKPLPRPDLGCYVFSNGGSHQNDTAYWQSATLALNNVAVGYSSPSAYIGAGNYSSAACFASQPWRLASHCGGMRVIDTVYQSGTYTDPMYISVPCG